MKAVSLMNPANPPTLLAALVVSAPFTRISETVVAPDISLANIALPEPATSNSTSNALTFAMAPVSLLPVVRFVDIKSNKALSKAHDLSL